MATEQAAQWAEPSGRESMACIAENTLQATTTAIERVGGGMTAQRLAQSARGWAARAARNTSSITRSTLRRLQSLTQQQARDTAREQELKGRLASEPALALVTPWLAGAAGAWLVYVSTSSWSQAALAGTCLFALGTLSAMRSTQRREALALRQQLAELRLSLRVTQALLDVEIVADVEHLEEDELEDARESGTRRLPRQRLSRPQVG